MKRTLSFFSLVAIFGLMGFILGGCSLGKKTSQTTQPANEAVTDESLTQNLNESPTNETPVVDEAAEVTDSSLENEVKSLDLEMDTVKTSGFEATNLSDKDLGL